MRAQYSCPTEKEKWKWHSAHAISETTGDPMDKNSMKSRLAFALLLLPIKANYLQVLDYTCGPASTMTLLNYYHMLNQKDLNFTTEKKLAAEMGSSPEVGTHPLQMVKWLQTHGMEVSAGINGNLSMIRESLKKGQPVLVEWIDWGGHWTLIVGYDDKNTADTSDDVLYFADPAGNTDSPDSLLNTFNAERFASMWFDAQYFTTAGKITRGIYILAHPKSP